jgi:phosphopantothenoylcysteine decarboxylase/phosphopantothenate--cysteine ligase
MDGGMYMNAATQTNIDILKERGVHFIGPAEGHLASGLTGIGRMEENEKIIRYVRYLFSRKNSLAGKKIVVTAGGTQEPIDPVRVITNLSSGKQGYALAQAALDSGADVTLISAPTHLTAPTGCKLIAVDQAEQMYNAVMAEISDAQALVMAAAVADFTPAQVASEKIKKEAPLTEIRLTPTRDILKAVNAYKKDKKLVLRVVGFAAESQNLKENAVKKMQEKGLDMIAANDITQPHAGFSVDTNQVLLIFADGKTEQLPLMNKAEVAERIMQELVHWLGEGVH